MFQRAPALLAMITFALLGGCGGGGGAGSAPNPSIVFSKSSLSAAAAVNALVPDPVAVSATISNVPSDAKYVGIGYSSDIIAAINLDGPPIPTPKLTVYFKEPFNLAPGTHQGTIQLELCRDSTCNNVVANSRASLSVTYDISAPGAQATPSASMDSTQISVAGLTTGETLSISPGTTLGGVQIPIHVTNVAYPISVSASTTTNTVVNAIVNPAFNGAEATLYVQLKYPTDLGVGNFHDVIQISTCLDPACVNPVGTGSLKVDVDYVVSDNISQPGPNGYTLRFVSLPNSDTFVVDSTRGLVHVMQSDISGAIITSVNPSTGAVVSKATGVTARWVLRLSDDGTRAYSAGTGGLVRLKVPDWTVDATVPFELPQFGDKYDVSDIQIIPGTNDSVVVSRTYGGAFGIPADVVAYDGAVKRSSSVITPYAGSGPDVAFLAWGNDASTIFGAPPPNGGSGSQASWKFAVAANGISLPSPAFAYGGGRFAYGFGRLFFPADGLQVVDATTGALVAHGLVPAASLSSVIADTTLGTVYALGQDAQGKSVLYVLDGQTLAVLRSTTFDTAYQPQGQIARWGANGLILRDTNRVYLLSGALVGP